MNNRQLTDAAVSMSNFHFNMSNRLRHVACKFANEGAFNVNFNMSVRFRACRRDARATKLI